MGLKKSNTGVVFYSRHCFNIACCGGTVCGGSCVNLQTDDNNCGSCGNTCSSAQTCTSGLCECPTGGDSLCSGSCVNLQTDNGNCGSCNTTCPSAQTCNGGLCECPIAGDSLCGSTCYDLQTDNNNCGSCGTSCTGGQSCSNGTCACAQGQTFCSGSCTNTLTDNSNCGSCGTGCIGGQCSNGTCTCPTGQTFCNGSCVDLQTDDNNCGSCGSTCTGGQCSNGTCACPTGQTVCSGSCVDLQTDPQNCGMCGSACPAGLNCVGAGCQCPTNGQPYFYLLANGGGTGVDGNFAVEGPDPHSSFNSITSFVPDQNSATVFTINATTGQLISPYNNKPTFIGTANTGGEVTFETYPINPNYQAFLDCNIVPGSPAALSCNAAGRTDFYYGYDPFYLWLTQPQYPLGNPCIPMTFNISYICTGA